MNFRDEISKVLVEHCGVEDEAFIYAIDTDGTVVANADPLADAVLNMPEMQALKAYVEATFEFFREHGWQSPVLLEAARKVAWSEVAEWLKT